MATTLCFLPETYLRNLEEKLTQNKLILKEELRTLLHLCESRGDMELAKNVIYRWGIFLELCRPLSPLTQFLFLSNLVYFQDFSHTLMTSKFLVQMPALSLTFISILLANMYLVYTICQVLRLEKTEFMPPQITSLFINSTYMSSRSSHSTYKINQSLRTDTWEPFS